MKKFKIIDFWVSVGLIISTIVFGFITIDFKTIIGYCIVGSWQIISMITHVFAKCNSKKRGRLFHYFLTLIMLVLFGMNFILHNLQIQILFILLIVTPFMAIYYTALCYWEIKAQNKL
jgi:hypothetical protein